MNPFPIPGQYATPPTCFPALPPNPPPSSSFWYSINVRHRLKELQETLTIAKALQMELEMQVKDNEDAKSGPDDPSLHQILKFVQDRGVDIGLEESYSVQAANALISKLRTQLEPFRIVTDNRSPWEEKSAALRLSNKINKSKRNKLWRKKKRNRVREMLEQHQQFDEADKAADEWRIREIAKDIARRKVENMKEIAKIKEKEVKRRLESELELVLIVEKLQELRSIRIQKLKKQGHFIPEEDDEYLERVRAAVEEEELLEIAATYADAAKDGIANVEGSWNPSQGSKPEVGDLNNAEPGKMEVIDQSSDLEAVKATGRDAAVQTLNLVSDGNAHDGTSDSVSNLPLEFYHYYHGSNHDIGTLIEVRKSWDDYIRPGGSRIPGQWVQPPSPANEAIMDGAWDICIVDGSSLKETDEFDSLSNHNNEGNEDSFPVSMDLVLPDDLLERILSFLPVASIFQSGSVCKRWYEIVSSKRFWRNLCHVLPQKPWYFMFTSSDEPCGYAYDPVLKKWYSIDLPCIETSDWSIASSTGLISFMDNDSRSRLYVCNPISKRWRKLEEPTGVKFSDYGALAISVNRSSHCYNLSVVKSKQVPGNFFQWDLSIHLYNSETMAWTTSLTEVLTGWRSGDESVICNGVLYFLLYSTGSRHPDNRHGLIMYDLSSHSSQGLLLRSFIPVPCPLTCGRLMNLKEKLVMVGGIGKQDRPGIIKGIGIWVLHDKQWQEITKMPHKFFQGFGEFDDVFASSGTDDLIYIQSYGGPALLVFDMSHKQWRWSQKGPVTKRFPLQLFSGFCFEPRLEIVP